MFIWLILSACSVDKAKECPVGLVPVPTTEPQFCIQPYEATITENQTANSQLGVQPSIHVSLEQAMQACVNTRLNGEPLRLVNYQEWVVAGGGQRFPFGDTYNGECVLDTPSTHGAWSDVEPTGSRPRCKSPFGVYDQIGNAWEWVLLEHTANRTDWIEQIELAGHTVTVSQTGIEIDPGALAQISLQTVCVPVDALVLEQDFLSVSLNQAKNDKCLSAGKGYLWFHQGNQERIPSKGALLPVELWGDRVVWDKARDGERVGAKVGGSFYSGGESTLASFWIGHIPTFDGSIGFRCVADPI